MFKSIIIPIVVAPLLASVVAFGVEALLLHKGNVSLVYMATVLFVATKTNTRTALACAGVSFLALNFFFTEPRMTLIMNHREDILTAVFFLLVAIVTGQLTARLKEQLSALRERDRVIQTERMEKEKELLRSALLSSISHDLRTPLSSLVGSASSLLELKDSLSEPQKVELIEAIQQEARRLDSYTQNLLDMTRLGRGDLKLERDWVAMEDIISSVVKRAKMQLPQAKLEVIAPPELPILHVHAALIGQAIFNLVDNAAKFSPPGEKVTISAIPARDQVEVVVTDRGPGIPVEEREHIFDMFHVLGHGDRDTVGTGLGLAICRGMIGAHGGRVFVTAPPEGRGTAMHIILPLSTDAPPEHTS